MDLEAQPALCSSESAYHARTVAEAEAEVKARREEKAEVEDSIARLQTMIATRTAELQAASPPPSPPHMPPRMTPSPPPSPPPSDALADEIASLSLKKLGGFLRARNVEFAEGSSADELRRLCLASRVLPTVTWQRTKAPDGRYYFYNPKTKQTSWTDPELASRAPPTPPPVPAADAQNAELLAIAAEIEAMKKANARLVQRGSSSHVAGRHLVLIS